MVTYEQMKKLISLKDRATLESEVSKLTETDAKVALVMTLLAWHRNSEINEQIDKDLRAQIEALQDR